MKSFFRIFLFCIFFFWQRFLHPKQSNLILKCIFLNFSGNKKYLHKTKNKLSELCGITNDIIKIKYFSNYICFFSNNYVSFPELQNSLTANFATSLPPSAVLFFEPKKKIIASVIS